MQNSDVFSAVGGSNVSMVQTLRLPVLRTSE